jgi:hypothetical protein
LPLTNTAFITPSTFANHNISVEAVVQKQIDAQDNAHIAIITNQVKTQDINAAAVAIQKPAIVIPRSLNEPVGFKPSYFT